MRHAIGLHIHAHCTQYPLPTLCQLFSSFVEHTRKIIKRLKYKKCKSNHILKLNTFVHLIRNPFMWLGLSNRILWFWKLRVVFHLKCELSKQDKLGNIKTISFFCFRFLLHCMYGPFSLGSLVSGYMSLVRHTGTSY